MSTIGNGAPAHDVGMFGRDFDELEIGQCHESGPRAVNSTDVAIFAALTGDSHPAHVDAEWAADGPFGGPIAHGMLVLSYAVGLLPLDPERVVALRRLDRVVFKRPLLVGEEIRVRVRIAALKPVDSETGLVGCEWRISGADGRLRVRAEVETVWRRGSLPAGRAGRAEAGTTAPAPAQGADLAPVHVHGSTMEVLL
jgi:3-hydroxybutyryl-CoA dehydratase